MQQWRRSRQQERITDMRSNSTWTAACKRLQSAVPQEQMGQAEAARRVCWAGIATDGMGPRYSAELVRQRFQRDPRRLQAANATPDILDRAAPAQFARKEVIASKTVQIRRNAVPTVIRLQQDPRRPLVANAMPGILD